MISVMIKIIGFLSIFNVNNVQSQALVGGARDDHSCLISAGYTWCESSQSCIRQWETPCSDNWSDCEDCLLQQRKGINIACPQDCDMIAIDPMPPVAIDPLPPSPPLPPTCSEVMCMMYCEDGNKLDKDGCPICECNDHNIHLPVPISSPMPAPTPYPVPMPPSIPSPIADGPDSSSNSACPITQPSCDSYTYLCPRITEMTSCGSGGLDGHTTYRLSVILKPNMEIRNIYALFGDEINTFIIPKAWQSSLSVNHNLGGVENSLIATFPDAEWDSWLTIGLTNGDELSSLGSVGIPFGSWSEDSQMEVSNGAVFVIDPEIDSPIGEEIVISQLTIPNDQIAELIVSIQGKKIDNGIVSDVSKRSWTEPNVRFRLPSMNPLMNCISWYDGCNTCTVNNGRLGACTRMMCFREDTPRCLQYVSPEISGH